MGGCCCSSRSAGTDRTPFYYCPRTLEEPHVTSSSVSPGLLFNPNLQLSTPNTYRAPPAPLPYAVGLACSESVPESFRNCGTKTTNRESAVSQMLGEAVCDTAFEVRGNFKDPECKVQIISGQDTVKVVEDDCSKLKEPKASTTEEEDVCPTCLEEYDFENPRIITKCEHHFHLSCILEWMERSDTCPVCDQIMMFDNSNEE